MKNVPKVIYLQVGEDVGTDTDFKELREVSWCVDKVFNTDIQFVLHKAPCSTLRELLVQKQIELQKQVDEYDRLKDERSAEVYHNYKAGIEYAIKLIDELLPVA